MGLNARLAELTLNNPVSRPIQSFVVDTNSTVLCPYCGQRFEMEIDLFEGSHESTLDCEICCRPLRVRIELDAGQIASLDVQPG